MRELRARGCAAPVAMITAYAEDPEIDAARRAGLLKAVIAKPWSPSALLAEARRMAGRA